MATLIALGIPLFNVSYVSTRNTQLFGFDLAYPKNASYSLFASVINEWAIVPNTGIPYFIPAYVLLVPQHPPI